MPSTPAVAQEAPVFEAKRPGFRFAVYPNRIEIEERQLLSTKKDTILLRAVTDVTRQGVSGKLRITTNDARSREWIIGTRADEARDAILALL